MKNNKFLWIVSFIPLIVTLIVLQFLPDKIPMHYDMAGNIDRWGSKYEQFIFPVIILGLSFMWQCMISYFEKKSESGEDEKQRAEAGSNIKILRLVAVAMAVMFGIMHIVSMYSAYIEAVNMKEQSVIDINVVVNILSAVVFIIVGNYIPKAKRNAVVGFRTKKSLSDDAVWRKTNRFAGITLMIAGVLIIIETLLVRGMLSTVLMVAILLVMAVVDLIYAVRL